MIKAKDKIAIPLTSDDLRAAADVIDRVVDALTPLEGETGVWQLSVEIQRQDMDEAIGEVKFYDGWLGFFPYSVVDD